MRDDIEPSGNCSCGCDLCGSRIEGYWIECGGERVFVPVADVILENQTPETKGA